MKITAIIPARGGSQSIPKKNIISLGGHPLIAYSIAAAKLSPLIDEIIVSTDSEEIAQISRKYGALVPFRRPSELAQNKSLDIEFFEHYLAFCRQNNRDPGDYLVHLRPTTPFRKIDILNKGIEYILSVNEATSLRSVHSVPMTPYKIFKMEGKYLKGFFPNMEHPEYYNQPRQIYPEAVLPNGYVDVIKTSIIGNNILHGDRMLAFQTPKAPDLDSYEDLKYAEDELKNNPPHELIQWLNQGI